MKGKQPPSFITCANCRWYLPADSRQGECRFQPIGGGYRWAMTAPSEWCSHATPFKVKVAGPPVMDED